MNTKNITIEEARAKISPTSDIFARWLLSAPNHEHLTKAFINAVLEDAERRRRDNAQESHCRSAQP